MSDDFAVQRERSKVYEIAFSNWLQKERGYFVLPTYDYSGAQDNKAPRLMRAYEGLVIPDLFATNGNNFWFEIKLKDRTDLYRKTNTLVTGCALRHWNDYQRVKQLTNAPVWLIFIHEAENAVMTGELDTIPVSHRYEGDKMGRGGMIFFLYKQLTRMFSMDYLTKFTEKKHYERL